MVALLICPGSGPVSGRATLENAYRNMTALLEQAGLPPEYERDVTAKEEGGRFEFFVRLGKGKRKRKCSISMPGCLLERLTSGLIEAPRLYIDGSSWWFENAVSVLRGCAGVA